MIGYFRCDEPTGQCPHAQTQDVLSDRDHVCPINKSDCRDYRQPVPRLTAWRVRNPLPFWTVTSIVSLALLLLILSLLLGGPGWKDEVEELQGQLAALQLRLTDIEVSQPAGPPSSGSTEFYSLRERIPKFVRDVDRTLRNNALAEGQRLSTEAQRLSAELGRLRGGGNDANVVNRLIQAQQLTQDFQSLEVRLEESRSLEGGVDQEAYDTYTDVIAQVRDGARRARSLATTPRGGGVPPEEVNKLQGMLTSASERLAAFVSKAKPPFDPAAAGLAIAADKVLVESLVLPLLQARFGVEKSADTGEGRWFITTTDDPVAPGIVVNANGGQPYDQLVDGSADLVISVLGPDDAVATKFAEAFDGQSLYSRAFSEVVALDAVALLGHPNASTESVDLAELSAGPWLVRAGDADLIRRLTDGAITLREVQDPFARVLAGSRTRALAFYHQCKVNLPARLLPLKAAAEARTFAPSPFSIGTEDYRLAVRIVAACSPRSAPAARNIIQYLTSDRGQQAIASAGFVDLRLRHKQTVADPAILATLAKALDLKSLPSGRASRYSTNLRFGVNEHVLDIKAQADLTRLPRALARDFPNGKVVILGFTDSTGGPEVNVPLSLKRAQTIADELKKFGISVAAAGLGQQFPIASNDTEADRARNRRAEIWVVQL